MPNEPVLVVDDDLSMRQFLEILLTRDGYSVTTAASGEAALQAAESSWPRLVLTDLNMPGLSGMELLRELKARGAAAGRPDVTVVMVTAHGSAENAVEAMKNGATDYVMKPFNNDEIRLVVRRALGQQSLLQENSRLRAALQQRYHFDNLVGISPPMQAVYDLINRVKETRINCLLLGESGTGKELVARAIHFSGARADFSFVAINCGAIPENLVESELFGHKRGSFTGAVSDKVGLVAEADRGTLFLDEVNSLPLSTQVKLLRAIQERRFLPVGGTREVSVDVRILAASNADLEDLVRQGEFREDLYYRLNVVQIRLPPLRERAEDIGPLASRFIEEFSEEYNKAVGGITPDALDALRCWTYPGNVRELRNTIERAVALCPSALVGLDDLPERMRGFHEPIRTEEALPVGNEDFPSDGVNLDAKLAEVEKRWLIAALEQANGNKTSAAKLLQMSFRSFRYRLAKYGLDG